MAAKNLNVTGSCISINTVTRKLQHCYSDRLIKEYPIAVGKPSTPTPPGQYKIKNKTLYPGGVLGTRWMGMDIPGGNYGIHGNNNPSSIGQAVSLGCVRMHNYDIEELFPQITMGAQVNIYGRFEPSTATDPAPTFGKEQIYTVKAGDTLWKIATSFNVPLETLIAANNLTNPNLIEPGQVIIIPYY